MTRKRLLIADDHESVRFLLATILSRAEFDVDTASNGEHAAQQAAENPPALVLMDLMMPVMDGWEATRRIRAEPATASVPVVAVTAHDHRNATAKLREAGFSAYLSKPFTRGEVLRAVELCLQAAAEGRSWTDLPPSGAP
jgi:CheY-like chemotaxis protein